MTSFLGQFIDLLATILYIAIIARVIFSWFPIASNNPLVALVYQITEPILAPLRRVIPRIGLFDFTPMVAIILIAVVQQILRSLV